MKRLSVAFSLFSLTAVLAGQGLGELFQKAKDQVKAASYEEAVQTLDRLDTESRKPGFEKDRTALEPVIAFYRGVCLASLGKAEPARSEFEIYLRFAPDAVLDRGMYSKKVITALEDARKAIARRGGPTDGSPSLEAAYRQFRLAQPPSSDPPREDWGEGPVRFFLTAQEKQDWSRLSEPVSRSEYVTQFWAARDPKPETAENEFRTELERRVAFADASFAQDETRGSLTDRGMVFLLLGPPTYVGRKPLTTGEDVADSAGLSSAGRHDAALAQLGDTSGRGGDRSTTGKRAAAADKQSGPGTKILDAAANWQEVWHYRKEVLPSRVPYLQVDFDFLTRKGYGKNVLERNAETLNTLEAARKSARGAPR